MKTIFITWHLPSHGIAYFKHVLAAFYTREIYTSKGWKQEELRREQEELNSSFEKKKKGFLFDKVYYLTPPQKVFDKITRRRFESVYEVLKYPAIKNDKELLEMWKKLLEEFPPEKGKHRLEEETKFIQEYYGKEGFRKWMSELWRVMQFYPVEDQIEWIRNYSNLKDVYSPQRLEIKIFDKIKDYRNISERLKYFLPYLNKIKEKFPDARYIINVSLTRAETHLMWYLLNENLYLPQNLSFISIYDERYTLEERKKKGFKEKYFFPMVIKKVPTNLQEFLPPLTPKIDKYPSREILEKQFEKSFKAGFSVLLLGERGTGKSQFLRDYAKKTGKKLISANCASFTDNSLAQSELFGYKKGAFTGANQDKKGLFEEANGEILFLDEVHHLDKFIQAKLLLALQTDKDNNFKIRKLGDNKELKVKCNIIFASNLPVAELKQKLLPDFYDRIAQSIIEFPPVRTDKKNIKTYFKQVWEKLQFGKHETLETKTFEEISRRKDFPDLIKWIKTLPLDGNFRDLEKNALYYFQYLNFDPELQEHFRKHYKHKNVIDYVKYMFETYHLQRAGKVFPFRLPADLKNIDKEFKKQLSEWAIKKYGNKENAAEALGIDPSTLYRWKNP